MWHWWPLAAPMVNTTFFPAQHQKDHLIASPSADTGLFLAPQTTGEALKGGRLVAEVLSRDGYNVIPAAGMPDVPSMITAVEMGSKEGMVAFCKAIQKMCPVGSYIEPVPGKLQDFIM